MSLDSQCIPAIVTRVSGASAARFAIERVVARVVEHRPQVVRHAAVDGDVGPDARNLLDRADLVKRDAGVADERAPGLDQDPRHRIEDAL